MQWHLFICAFPPTFLRRHIQARSLGIDSTLPSFYFLPYSSLYSSDHQVQWGLPLKCLQNLASLCLAFLKRPSLLFLHLNLIFSLSIYSSSNILSSELFQNKQKFVHSTMAKTFVHYTFSTRQCLRSFAWHLTSQSPLVISPVNCSL